MTKELAKQDTGLNYSIQDFINGIFHNVKDLDETERKRVLMTLEAKQLNPYTGDVL